MQLRSGGRSLASAGLVTAITCLGGATPAHAQQRVQGVIISTHTWGVEWGWDAMLPTLQEVQALGANWVSIHPYATIRGDGRVQFDDWEPGSPPAYLVRPIREAHRLGMKILIKPHLAYWGSRFSWRGEIAFDRAQDWQRFFTGYRRWIVKLARATRDADAFVVGTELDRTLHHEDAWRQIIRAVRAQTRAHLTYGANWPDYQRVPFWDALDAVGVQAYFPLSDRPAPPRIELEAGWMRWMDQLGAFSRRIGKPIVFTELGYAASFTAPVEPWSSHVDRDPAAELVQETCLRVALEAVEREPSVVGAFLWKWFPQPHSAGHNFRLATPRMRAAIRDSWVPR